ncbi:cytochrome c-type biogenesis protein CcmH [Candidatus Poribacteria bacterium]|nr:cytochrome c-type biogenesis protein CcmH [Candidatus Poribacteria bacterium]MYK17589.1 cytochrome c-type biogenesis protein CcmH [Candidatus Poribacteria bacterium]
MKIGKLGRLSTSISAVFLVVCFFSATVYAQTETSGVSEVQNTADAQFESKLNELLTTVYCYCGCERETIEVCVCGTAEQIETDFRNQLLVGQTVEQIRTNYLDRYGPQFYAVMPAEGINLIAYIMPAVILVLIGGVAFVVLRKSKQVVTTTDSSGTSSQQVSDTTLKQVEAELERYKQEK